MPNRADPQIVPNAFLQPRAINELRERQPTMGAQRGPNPRLTEGTRLGDAPSIAILKSLCQVARARGPIALYTRPFHSAQLLAPRSTVGASLFVGPSRRGTRSLCGNPSLYRRLRLDTDATQYMGGNRRVQAPPNLMPQPKRSPNNEPSTPAPLPPTRNT